MFTTVISGSEIYKYLNGLTYDEDTQTFYAINYSGKNKFMKISLRTKEVTDFKLNDTSHYTDLHYVVLSPDRTCFWATDYMGHSIHKISVKGECFQKVKN